MNNFKSFIISTLLIIAIAFIVSLSLGFSYLIPVCATALIGFAAYIALEADNATNKTLKNIITKGFIISFLVFTIVSLSSDIIKFNNKVVAYTQERIENDNNKESFTTNLYIVYTEKQKITNLHYSAFIEVTNIIMSNRKDGESLAWKWLQENQPIPYEEFTAFYKDLSNFINTYRTEIYKFDRITNNIVKEHNTMLDVFPNNIYNKLLNKPYLN